MIRARIAELGLAGRIRQVFVVGIGGRLSLGVASQFS